MEQQIRYLAEYDQLTELPNRYRFEMSLRRAIERASRASRELALLMLDLDEFKTVNDALGHEIGDRLLKEVKQRLVSVVRSGDLISRLGGDEFLALIEEFRGSSCPVDTAHRLIEVLDVPFEIGGYQLPITASIGVAIYPYSGPSAEELMRSADMAMYQAKRRGRNMIQVHSEAIDEEVRQRARVGWELRRALDDEQFRLYYQPQIDAGTGKVAGFEALVRWQHPEQGLLEPSSFLPIANDLGLINLIGEWVICEACRVMGHWLYMRGAHEPTLGIAVNMSDRDLRSPTLPSLIDHGFSKNALPAGCLEIELTETALIRDPDRTAEILEALSARNIRITIDDFGVGYSSLQHLKLFPIHALKIDRRFVRESELGGRHKRFLYAIIDLAKALGIKVVAEGVETASQDSLCRQAGCHLLQGFYYYTLLPLAEAEILATSSYDSWRGH